MSANALIEACKIGNLVQVKAQIMMGQDVNTFQDAPLEEACIHGHIEVVKLLIDEGANAKDRDFCAVRMAAKHDRLKILQYLLEEAPQAIECRQVFNNQTFLTDICAHGAIHTLQYLLKTYSTINPYAQNSKAFKWALNMHNEEVIDYLMYDYRYQLTEDLAQWLNDNHHDILEQFHIRDRYDEMNDKLSINETSRKAKI